MNPGQLALPPAPQPLALLPESPCHRRPALTLQSAMHNLWLVAAGRLEESAARLPECLALVRGSGFHIVIYRTSQPPSLEITSFRFFGQPRKENALVKEFTTQAIAQRDELLRKRKIAQKSNLLDLVDTWQCPICLKKFRTTGLEFLRHAKVCEAQLTGEATRPEPEPLPTIEQLSAGNETNQPHG